MKDSLFLVRPINVLDVKGDRYYLADTYKDREQEIRGGEPYHRPIGWQRYGLNMSLLKYENNSWLASDGNENEWAVAYYGLRVDRALYTTLFDTNGKFSPSFKAGMGQVAAKKKDKNPKSSEFNKDCGCGHYLSVKADIAENHTCNFTINGEKYRVILQCRVNPKKMRKPEGLNDVIVINRSEDIRPYGILIKLE